MEACGRNPRTKEAEAGGWGFEASLLLSIDVRGYGGLREIHSPANKSRWKKPGKNSHCLHAVEILTNDTFLSEKRQRGK